MSWGLLPLEIKYNILTRLRFYEVAFINDEYFWLLFCQRRSSTKPDPRMTWKNTAYRDSWLKEFLPSYTSSVCRKVICYDEMPDDEEEDVVCSRQPTISTTLDRRDTVARDDRIVRAAEPDRPSTASTSSSTDPGVPVLLFEVVLFYLPLLPINTYPRFVQTLHTIRDDTPPPTAAVSVLFSNILDAWHNVFSADTTRSSSLQEYFLRELWDSTLYITFTDLNTAILLKEYFVEIWEIMN